MATRSKFSTTFLRLALTVAVLIATAAAYAQQGETCARPRKTHRRSDHPCPLPTSVLSICLYGLLEAVIMLLVARSEADYTV